MTNLLFSIVSDKLSNILGVDKNEITNNLEVPPEQNLGDVAFPCFVLSKKLRKSPIVIAQEIKSKLDETNDGAFREIKVVSGYLNFFLNRNLVLQQFLKEYTDGNLFDDKKHKGEKALIEHTSINPNASPHIGRARNALIGDASSRLL